jgi:DsbC/DsbD-like thiol-disulfide interchange protein
MKIKLRTLAGLAIGLTTLLAWGQVDSASRSVLKGAAVEYMYPEQVTVTAGKATDVALHFRVAQGLHINSHTPKEEFLIPTSFSIPDGSGVRLETANYPVGKEFSLPADPGNKLIVYTDDFVIQARIVATPGNHLVEAKLHFQACDKEVCLPPKTIPVAIDVIGK